MRPLGMRRCTTGLEEDTRELRNPARSALCVAGASLLIPLLAGAGCWRDAKPTERIVLITLDTLRLDAFAGGEDLAVMARTRARAKQGLIFDRHYSATSSTQPSHATLFTGLHPWQHGVPRNGVILDDAVETVAERLLAAGFRTAAVVASFPVHRQFGFAQGFEVYVDDFSEGRKKRWSGVPRDELAFYSPADEIRRKAESLLDELGGERQFFWFHFFDAHSPYGDRSPGGAKGLRPKDIFAAILEDGDDPQQVLASLRERYTDDVRFLDRQLDALLDRLIGESHQIQTHILVVADHGESLGDDGTMGHGKRLTEPLIHVPLFILSPRVKPERREDPVGSIDVAATILDLAGLPGSSGASRSLIGPRDKDRRVVGMRRTYAEPFEERRIDGSIHIVDGLWFYAVHDNQVYTGNSEEITLYDTAAAAEDPDRVRALKLLFAGFEREYAERQILDVSNPESLERLRALGYLQ